MKTLSLLPRDTLKGGHLTGSQQFGVHPLGCSSWRVEASRCARSKTRQARPPRWSGCVAVILPKACIILTALLDLSLSGSSSQAQPSSASTAPAVAPAPPPAAPARRSAADLEKLAIPIALHPDPLIAIILPASAYPLEIVQAARFVKDTNNIPKVDEQPWDENVKAVAKFPELIVKMDADLTWTMNLGQAFVDQPKELMDTIQALRSKAQKAGNLKTTPQQIVTVTNIVVQQTNITEVVNVTKEIIEVVPANPSVIYVPSYPPAIYYPWYPYYAYPAPVCAFGVGLAWGFAWGAVWGNNCNWGGGCVNIDIDSNRNVNRNRDQVSPRSGDRASNTSARSGSGKQQWKPDQNRMQRSGASPNTREARGWASGGARPTTGNVGSRPSTGTVGSRPSTGNVGSRPSTGNVGARPSTGNTPARSSVGSTPRTSPSTSQFSGGSSYGNRSSSGASAFDRSGGGSSTRSSSYRGTSSRGGGGFSGGGGRGGGGRR